MSGGKPHGFNEEPTLDIEGWDGVPGSEEDLIRREQDAAVGRTPEPGSQQASVNKAVKETLERRKGHISDQPKPKQQRLREELTADRKKAKKKHKRKGRALRDMAFETQKPAQAVMRDEMARGVHQPQRLADTLTGVFGPMEVTTVTPLALSIITEGPNLELSFAQWAIVQQLVEAGIRRGYDIGSADRAHDIGG